MVIQKQCRNCRKLIPVEVDQSGFEKWEKGELLIQQALPKTPKELRELLVSGNCPTCWDKLFGEEV